jgi:predicted lipoprotein with Yx(FWY)xxD motif
MSNESNIRKMPSWYSEGTAQYVAEWLAREKGYAESIDNFATKMGQLWDEAIVAYGNGTRVKDGEQYPINNPLSVWAVAFMIEKATARSGITNGVQEILITIPNQVNEKGWYKTFQDNTGITLETFYTQFNSALSVNDKSTRVSNLVTSNFASTVTGKYNYSVLQLTGADTSVNSGGTPSAAARTLYFYDNDTSTIPSYQGGYSGAWPYVVTSKNITKATEISASITKNANGNYVLVANKPVYQYASDTATSKSGATINLWKAIKPDGTGVDGTKIAP